MAEQQEQQPDTPISMDLNTDENLAGTTHLNESVGEESELERLREALEEEKKKYLYLFAEFDNFKRRTSKERLELIQTAGKEVIVSLLEVLDDADRAEAELAKKGEVDPGVKLVFHKLRTILQSRGLKAMESIGQPFDADKHEAITEVPAPEPGMQGKVVDEVEKGYLLNDKIIRFAKVVVGK
ncbi:MAG: nucleotide exchange factor GrpE [Lacibacter sp.]